MRKPNYKDYFKTAACPKCKSDDLDSVGHDYEGDAILKTVSCSKCGFKWVDVYELVRFTDADGKILAEKDPCPSDLTIIMEFAWKAMNDYKIRRDMLCHLDLSDDEGGRIIKVVNDYIDPPKAKACILCGEQAYVDDLCKECSEAVAEGISKGVIAFNKAMASAPHDTYEEKCTLEDFAHDMARTIKKRIKP
jgi:Zn ribbon nucleic-acid-binding protein